MSGQTDSLLELATPREANLANYRALVAGLPSFKKNTWPWRVQILKIIQEAHAVHILMADILKILHLTRSNVRCAWRSRARRFGLIDKTDQDWSKINLDLVLRRWHTNEYYVKLSRAKRRRKDAKAALPTGKPGRPPKAKADMQALANGETPEGNLCPYPETRAKPPEIAPRFRDLEDLL